MKRLILAAVLAVACSSASALHLEPPRVIYAPTEHRAIIEVSDDRGIEYQICNVSTFNSAVNGVSGCGSVGVTVPNTRETRDQIDQIFAGELASIIRKSESGATRSDIAIASVAGGFQAAVLAKFLKLSFPAGDFKLLGMLKGYGPVYVGVGGAVLTKILLEYVNRANKAEGRRLREFFGRGEGLKFSDLSTAPPTFNPLRISGLDLIALALARTTVKVGAVHGF